MQSSSKEGKSQIPEKTQWEKDWKEEKGGRKKGKKNKEEADTKTNLYRNKIYYWNSMDKLLNILVLGWMAVSWVFINL